MPRILCPTVVGRQSELGRIYRALDDAAAGNGGLTVVSGPAGVGKSRLLAECASAAAGRAMAVLAGRCVPAAVAAPYRPLAEALITASAAQVHAGSPAALGRLLSLDQEAPTPESPVVVAEAVLRALQAAAGSTGCALLIEDIQWADPETLHALEYLADHTVTTRVLVVAALRDDAPCSAQELTARLEARRAVDRIALPPLSGADVAEMAARSLDASALDPDVLGVVVDAADGLPFLVEELLATAVTSGALAREGPTWRLTQPLGRVVPESFALSVRERLHGMGPEGRRVLGAAALLGRSFDWRMAGRAAGCATAVTHEVLERGVELQLLRSQGDGFAFRHALTRDAILGELLPHERAELATGCLAAIDAAAATSLEARLVAAGLAELAGQPEAGAALLLEAARTSLSRGALESATTALLRARGLATEPGRLADLEEALAEAASGAGDIKRTRAHVSGLLDHIAGVTAQDARRANAHLMLARCATTAAHFDLAHEELDRASRLAADAGDDALAARITAVRAQLAVGEGETDAAEALASAAAGGALATGQPEVACEALEVASRCARTRDLEQAAEFGEQALQIAESSGLAYWRMRALYQIGVVELFRDYGLETLRRAQAEARRLGAVATATSLGVEIVAGLEATHRREEALRAAADCLEMARRLDLRAIEAIALLFVAILEAGQGRRGPMEEALHASAAILPGDVELTGAAWGDARAIASLAAEDRVRARQDLEAAAAVYERAPTSVLPRLGMALRVLLDSVDGRPPGLDAALGITRLNTQGAGYLAFGEAVRLGRAGRHAEAMDAVRTADRHLVTCPWYRQLCRRLTAEAALHDGWGEPVAWLTEAAAFFDEAGNERMATACRAMLRRAGAKVSRPLRALRDLPVSLRTAGITPREAEVLRLLADGLTNREIAERLFLSERTVEQHVGWLKQKLGRRTRAQLAVFAAAEVTPPR